MADLTRHLALAFALSLATLTPAAAQEAPPADAPATEAPATDAPVTEAPTAAPGDGDPEIGASYVSETHGDWEVQCVRAEDGNDPCQLYQLLHDETGNSVAEISIFGLPEGQQAAAGATVVTPLETLLTEQIQLQVDSGEIKVYPFSFCARIGCIARIGFTEPEVQAMQRGRVGVLTIVPVAAPDQEVRLEISLAGFTAGLAAVQAANASIQP